MAFAGRAVGSRIGGPLEWLVFSAAAKKVIERPENAFLLKANCDDQATSSTTAELVDRRVAAALAARSSGECWLRCA